MRGSWWRRVLTAQLIVDESWAIAQRDDGRLDRHLLVGAGLLLLVCWTIGTAVGAFAGVAVKGIPSGMAAISGAMGKVACPAVVCAPRWRRSSLSVSRRWSTTSSSTPDPVRRSLNQLALLNAVGH